MENEEKPIIEKSDVNDLSSGEFSRSDEREEKKKKENKLFWNLFFYFVIIGGIVFGLPRILIWALDTPYPMAAITSGSMWPALKQGDLVLVKGVDSPEDLEVGEIIVFKNRTNNTLTIHRIVKIGDKITTKGDANFNEDVPVNFSDVVGETLNFRGKPIRIPKLGAVTIFVGSVRKTTNEGP